MAQKKYSGKGAFNPELDETLWEARTEENQLPRDNIISVGVFSYNKGIPKIQFGRETSQGEKLKMGRLSVKEMELAMPLCTQAIEFIKQMPGEGKQEVRNQPLE
jgi:hypothetical protein